MLVSKSGWRAFKLGCVLGVFCVARNCWRDSLVCLFGIESALVKSLAVFVPVFISLEGGLGLFDSSIRVSFGKVCA